MAVIRKLSLIIDEDDDGAAVLRSKKFKLAFFDRKGYFKDAFEVPLAMASSNNREYLSIAILCRRW